MISAAALWSFVVVVGLLTITPGLDTALVLRTAALESRRRAWGVVAGIQTGTIAWGVLASAGIAALLTASQLAYDVLRWVGAAYLVWIGVRMLLAARRPADAPGAGDASADDPEDVPEGCPHDRAARGVGRGREFRGGWRRGLATNLLNPKMGAFYVALLPQFVPQGASPLGAGVLLAGVHVVLGTAWSAVLVVLAHRARAVLRRPLARRVADAVTGTVITAFGVRLAAVR